MSGGIASASFSLGTVVSGGGGSAVEIGGEEIVVAGGGGGAGMCNDGAGGNGGANSDVEKGHDYRLANGGSPGRFTAGPVRSTGDTMNKRGRRRLLRRKRQ